MSGEAGGWMWLLMDVVLVAVLAAAMAYGILVWRRRGSGTVSRVRDQAIERLYQRGDPENRESNPRHRAK